MSGVTFITGASSGLGAGLAPLFAQDGDTVFLAARRGDAIEALAERLRADGGTAHAIPLDVSDHDAVREAFAQVVADVGPIDTLVCNAGIGDSTPAVGFDADTLEHIFGINVFGVAYCIEAALPGMLERNQGQLVATLGSRAGAGQTNTVKGVARLPQNAS